MSLRLRLTLLTTILVVLATAALGTAVYIAAERLQMANIDESLYADISEARVRSMQDDPRPPQDGVYIDTALGRLNRDGINILPLRDAGTIDSPIRLPRLTPADITAASQAPITVNDGIDFRVAIRSHGAGLATVVAASPLTEVQENLALLARAIIVFGIAVALIGAVASWLLVRRSFRPMNAMVDAAKEIADGETDRRLPEAKPGTEIGELTASMNVMIDSLAAAVTRVEQSEDHLRSFVSDASHEIRTPLTVIRGYSELLIRNSEVLGDQERRALERIESESKRLDRLVTNLLTLERSTTPHRGPASRIDVSAAVRECAEDVAVLDPTRKVDISTPTECFVMGDPDGLRQLLSNAVQNILRHTPQGSPVQFMVTVSDGWIDIALDDAGPGLAPEVRTGMARGATSSAEGFGLGLAIMQAVTAQFAGTMSLTQSPLGGLRVGIRLPAAT